MAPKVVIVTASQDQKEEERTQIIFKKTYPSRRRTPNRSKPKPTSIRVDFRVYVYIQTQSARTCYVLPIFSIF